MPSMPWFRFYSETLSDRKIKRICMATGQPKALIVGVWATILALANDSPDRGSLLISEDMPLTNEEVRAETGLDEEDFEAILSALFDLQMLDVADDGTLFVVNWDKRNFKSDNSSARVREWREQKEAQEQEEPQQEESQEDGCSNGAETLQERCDDVIEEDTESDTYSLGVPKTPTGKNKLKADLEGYFAEITKIPKPTTKTNRQRSSAASLWWTPLLEIASLVDYMPDRARLLMMQAVQHMDGDGLTISSPKSIVKVCQSLAGRMARESEPSAHVIRIPT